MSERRIFIGLALIGIVASILACNAPAPAAPTESPVISPPQETGAPATIETPPEATPTSAPMATGSPPTATATATPTVTPTSAPPVSTGPLNFEEPYRIYSWESLPNGQKRVLIKIKITGGAPPFTISHEREIVGKTWEREYLVEFLRSGCTGIAYIITVESADGQSISKDYWIGTDEQPWCK